MVNLGKVKYRLSRKVALSGSFEALFYKKNTEFFQILIALLINLRPLELKKKNIIRLYYHNPKLNFIQYMFTKCWFFNCMFLFSNYCLQLFNKLTEWILFVVSINLFIEKVKILNLIINQSRLHAIFFLFFFCFVSVN